MTINPETATARPACADEVVDWSDLGRELGHQRPQPARRRLPEEAAVPQGEIP